MILTNARPERYLFALLIGATPLVSHAEVLFEENFDDQPDWTSEMYSGETQKDVLSGDTMPIGWDASYTGGGFGHDAIEILASQSDKARGGTGKAFVSWKEHNAQRAKQFVSNSTLAKRIDGPDGNGVDQLYAEFWIRFDPNWTAEENMSKFFRVYASRPGGNIFNAFSGGDSGPMLIFDYQHSNNFGAQNRLAFRGGPYGDNYKPSWAPSVPDKQQNFLGGSQFQQIPDKKNGGLIPVNGNSEGIVTHDMVWGPPAEGQWTKLGFFVKMNSANDVADGVFMQWRDDHLVLKSEEVQWIRPNSQGLNASEVKWNVVAIGGNDYIGGAFPHPIYPNSAEHEEWYAIDDFLVSTEIPTTVMDGPPSRPEPPTSIEIK